MNAGIGGTLREARNRRKIDLSEVEASTKIRLRYLRAIENEEWEVLPGEAYTRGFIRTYALYLGLDGDRLADEFRRGSAAPAAERPLRAEAQARLGAGRRALRLPPRVAAVILAGALIVAVVAIGLSSGGESGPAVTVRATGRHQRSDRSAAHRVGAPRRLSLELAARAEVWVCLLDAGGRRLINGRILEAGAEEGPFHARGFTLSLGNGEVSLRVNGRRTAIASTSSPIGYAVGSGGHLRQLAEAERPTCT